MYFDADKSSVPIIMLQQKQTIIIMKRQITEGSWNVVMTLC